MRQFGNRIPGNRGRSFKKAAVARAKVLAIESLERRGMLSATTAPFADDAMGDVEVVSVFEQVDDAGQYAEDCCAVAFECSGEVDGMTDDGSASGFEYVDEGWNATDYDYMYGGVNDSDYENVEYASDDSSRWTDGLLTTGCTLVLPSTSHGEDFTWSDSFSLATPAERESIAVPAWYWESQPWEFGVVAPSYPFWQRGAGLRLECNSTLGSISEPAPDDFTVVRAEFVVDANASCLYDGLFRCDMFPPALDQLALDGVSAIGGDDLVSLDRFTLQGDEGMQRSCSFEASISAAPQVVGEAAGSPDSGVLAAAAAWFNPPNVDAEGPKTLPGKRRAR